jgi:polysaccharide biosynthesis transport protein
MELKTYLSIIKRRWQILLLVCLSVSLVFAFGSIYYHPNYQADARLQVITPLGGSLGDTYHETTFANRLMNTYAQVATSDQVMNDLKAKLGIDPLPDISVKIIPDSEIIQIMVKSSDPSLVALTANTLSELIITKQNEVLANNINSEELAILTNRRDELAKGIDLSRQRLDQLISGSSQTDAELAVLDRKIKLKETSYQSLLSEYQQAYITESVSPSAQSRSTISVLSNQIADLEKELETLDQDYKELSAKSNGYLQQIAVLRQTIQSDQSAYSDILNRYDSVLSTNLRQERAQDIILVSPAIKPTKPTGFGQIFIIGLGLICGLIIGSIAAFMYDNLDTRLFSNGQISLATHALVLGSFPKIRNHKEHTLPLMNENSTVHRDYWMLCARVMKLLQEKSLKTILVTSPGPQEGKSTITAALAAGMARNNHKVLVVDADLRRPQQEKLFQLTVDKGFDTFLTDNNSQIDDLIKKEVEPGIDLLPSLTVCEDPTDLLQSPRFNVLLKNIKKYDAVLFDTPALLVAPDAYTIAKNMDCVVVIAQMGQTTSEDLRSVCDHLEAVGARLLGVIMNQVPANMSSDYYDKKTGWKQRINVLQQRLTINSSANGRGLIQKLFFKHQTKA